MCAPLPAEIIRATERKLVPRAREIVAHARQPAAIVLVTELKPAPRAHLTVGLVQLFVEMVGVKALNHAQAAPEIVAHAPAFVVTEDV